jgi:hypothetical protein
MCVFVIVCGGFIGTLPPICVELLATVFAISATAIPERCRICTTSRPKPVDVTGNDVRY